MNEEDKSQLSRLKNIIKDVKSLDELINLMPFFSQEVNRAYLRQEDPNFERPALSFSIREGEKLTVHNDEIKVSSVEYNTYHIFEKDTIIYAQKILQEGINGDTPPLEVLSNFKFIGTTIIACEKLSPLYELDHWKSKEEAIRGMSTVSLKTNKRLLGKIFFNHKGESIQINKEPTQFLSLSGIEKTRIELKDNDFSFSSCGLLTKPKNKNLWSNKEESYIWHQYKISSKPISKKFDYHYNPNNEYPWEILESFEYFLKGNPDKIIANKKRMDDECDGFYEAQALKEKKIKELKNKK